MLDMQNLLPNKSSMAVVNPCYLEDLPICKRIADFQREVPEAHICVYANCNDGTCELAALAGTDPHHSRGFDVEAFPV